MASLFEAYITNLGKYNEGELVGETLKFPTTTEEVQGLLKRIGVDGVRYEEFFITSFDGDVLGLYDYLTEYENLDELNHLACLLSELEQSDLEKFEAVIDSGEHTSSVADLINLAQNLDCYEFYPGVEDDETLGRIYVEDMEAIDIPDHLLPYVIRRTILFDNKCGFVLGENPKAPNPYVTWQFNEQDGHRDFFWGHYHNEPDMAERDLHNRAEDYQRRYHVFEIEQAPDKETYKYYSTQRPIDIGTYPNSYFNRPVHMDLYFTRQQVSGESFQAWGAIIYAHPLTEREMQDYELRPARENLDIRRQMDAQAQVVGKWEDAHRVPDQKRLTWFYPDFGSYVVKEYITPEQLAVRVHSIERQEAARAHKEAKHQPPIAEQLKAAQREAQEQRAPDAPKKKAPDRDDR